MKKSLLIILLLLPTAMQAQSIQIPVDSATRKIDYQGVVKADGLTKDELYTRAREWFAKTFNSAKDVIQMDDKSAGKIIGKGAANGSYFYLLTTIRFTLYYTVSITVKDGRYRYEITDIEAQNEPDRYMPNPPRFPADIYVTDPKYKNKSGEYKMPGKGLLASINGAIPQIEETLKSALAATPTGVKSKDDF